ncbi:MAG TPA: M12 family metallopeptidase [Pedobacter sp.]
MFVLLVSNQVVFAKGNPKICTELGDSSLGATGRESLFWKKPKLRVEFLDGSEEQKQKVREFAVEWSKYANIKFEFVETGSSDIRISFKKGGSWSYIGTSAEKHLKQATMNFGWFDEDTTNEEFSRVILHEFGHALGLVHEHKSPGATIKWNESVVIKYYKDNFGWSANAVRESIFKKYNENQVNRSAYDPKSIMHYHIEEAWTMDDFSVDWNTKLSETDKSFIKKIYP